jgi:hypothetical protein
MQSAPSKAAAKAGLQLSDLVAAHARPRAVIVVSHVRFAKHGPRKPDLGDHSSRSSSLHPSDRPQSSKWLTIPSASFGSNQVDFGGMIAPASATAMRSLICVG